MIDRNTTDYTYTIILCACIEFCKISDLYSSLDRITHTPDRANAQTFGASIGIARYITEFNTDAAVVLFIFGNNNTNHCVVFKYPK